MGVQDLAYGWDHADCVVSRIFGDRWMAECRSAVLLVPSVVAREEWNAIVNPAHPMARAIELETPRPVIWDARLFGSRPE